MKPLKIGMIGAGFIGQLAHLMNFVEINHCELHALAEYKPELRRKVAARFSIPHAYATHHELLQNTEIDAVIVVTPRPYMGPVVLDCLNAGKHVLSEKPMAGSYEQGALLLAASQNKKVKYAVGYMKRFDEGAQAAKKALMDALQTNRLGKLLSVQATCFMGNSYCNAYGHVVTNETVTYPLAGWSIAPLWLPEAHHMSFAAYLNTYSHVTNLLRYLFDETPTVEWANLTEHAGQLVVLRFNDFLATLQTGKMSHRGWSEEVRMTFTDGELVLSLPPALLRNVPASVEIYQAGSMQQCIRPYLNWSWSFRRQAEAFVQDILEDRPLLNSAADALQEIQLIESIWQYEMHRLGRMEQVATKSVESTAFA